MNNGYWGLAIGAAAGALMTVVAIPDTPIKEGCDVYKVASKSVTSYVLKPPTQPAPDPIIVKEKCYQELKESDSTTDTELTKDENIKPHNKRRHRHRKYWR